MQAILSLLRDEQSVEYLLSYSQDIVEDSLPTIQLMNHIQSNQFSFLQEQHKRYDLTYTILEDRTYNQTF